MRHTEANSSSVNAHNAGRTRTDHFNAGSGNKTDIGEALTERRVGSEANDHAHVPATQVAYAVVYGPLVDVVQR